MGGYGFAEYKQTLFRIANCLKNIPIRPVELQLLGLRIVRCMKGPFALLLLLLLCLFTFCDVFEERCVSPFVAG